ncbi:MAG: hypothetical protein AUG51_17950 [Acidobacteria bacterium 13_1_20CM_3_53_8]|nr:MAG: hypothetical protein AUG51_17950 [Acidobacteria bacterium 13_1_20CM_3_53_8]
MVCLLSVLALSAFAQTNKGSISGNVQDINGAAVVGATVTVTNTETNAERTATSGGQGEYEVPLLEPGNYNVKITSAGFKPSLQQSVVVQTGTKTSLDVKLEPGEITGNQVTVIAGAPLVQTEESERGSVVTGREVTELPLSGRNFTQLATLTPGVSRVTIGTLSDARSNNNGDPNAGGQGPGGGNPAGSTESARFARSGGSVISANGQRPTNNNFSVDGVDNNEPQFGQIGVYVNPDAIAEFRVTTSVPPAEVGRAAGAVVNTSFRSGSNDFHGSLYYYGQNSALNATHPILARDINNARLTPGAQVPKKAVQQIHEFGGAVGGPIIKNKLFFFFDYLGGRNNLPAAIRSTVPSALMRAGNFSEFTAPLINPLTGVAFPGNIIPQAQISPVSQKFYNLFPLPNFPRTNPGQNDNNYFATREVREVINNYDIKIDHHLSNADTLSGRFSYQNQSNVRGSFFPEVPAGFGAGNEIGNSRQIAVTETHTFSPTMLNEARFGFTKLDIGIINCAVGGACGISATFASDVGVANVNDGSFERSGSMLVGGFGNGFVEFAGDGGPFIVNSRNPYFADTMTIIRGRNTFKFGGEDRLRYLHTIDGGRTGGLKGNYAYADNGPSTGPNPACPAGSGTPAACFVDANGIAFGGTGNAMANILDRNVASLQFFRGSVPGGAFNLRSQELGLFVQDDLKVNPNLTLNLGLRWDYFPPQHEANGRLGNYDPATRTVIVASSSSDTLIQADRNNFGPRAGFAYSFGADRNMVIRGGYGLLYTLDATDRPPLVNNPPFTNSVTYNNAFDASTPRSVFNLQTGAPNVPVVSPTALSLPGFFCTDPTQNCPLTVFRQDPQQRTAYVHEFNITYQVQFMHDWAFDIGYVGNRTRNLLVTRDIGGSGTAEARNPLGIPLAARLYTNAARADYNGLQMQLQKRLSHNVQGQVSYTFSKNTDTSTGVFQGIGEGRGTQGGPQNPLCPDTCEEGRSALDVRHLLSADVIIDLPFGRGQRYLSDAHGAMNRIASGWQLNFIVNGRSGFPFTVVSGNNAGRRATQIGDPFSNVPAGRFMNVAAFRDPAGACPGPECVVNAAGQQIRFGTLARNTFTGPGFVRTDMSVFKNTAIRENLRLQIGMEFFNLFNQTTFTVPNNNIDDAGSFGRFDAALPARVIQYRVKLLF